MSAAREAARAMLSAANLRFSVDSHCILDGVDFSVAPGEVVLLRGANGSGKTTLLNILTGFLLPTSGRLAFVGAREQLVEESFPRTGARWNTRWTAENLARLGLRRAWQESRLFPDLTVLENLAVAIREEGRDRFVPSEPIMRLNEVLLALDLADVKDSTATKLSFGQSRRLSTARALLGASRLLVLDEPLAGLDNVEAELVCTAIRGFIATPGTAAVVVEHDSNLGPLLPVVSRVAELTRGRMSAAPTLPTRDSIDRATAQREERLRESWRGAMVPHELPRATLALRSGARLTLTSRVDASGSKPALVLTDVTLFSGSTSGDKPISFELNVGDLGVLRAPNGWGKSTLFAAISGLLPVLSGRITLFGQDITHESPWRRVEMGLRPHSIQLALLGALRVNEALSLSTNVSARDRFAVLATRACSALSGGERQRLAIAMQPPGGLGLYDEPETSLDSSAESESLLDGSVSQCVAALLLLPGRN